MSNLTSESIRNTLKQVQYPGFTRDIVSFGLVSSIDFNEDFVSVSLELTTADPHIPVKLKTDIEQALKALDGVNKVEVNIAVNHPQKAKGADNEPQPIPGIRYTIAVASGKGGVGKSTVAVNLACALGKLLSEKGKSNAVGIMDCDIYGPSVPIMMGVNKKPEVENNKIKPIENFGVRIMSMGFLIDKDAPVVWRGPMVNKAIVQFIQNVDWGELEILVIDLPPGTGDAHLTLTHTVALDGAVIVTTPQLVAINVAMRGAVMFDKVNVPLLGVVENMSFLEVKEKSERQYLFGRDGGAKTAHILGTQLMGQVPLALEVRESSDRGLPVVISLPESSSAKVFQEVALKIWDRLNEAKSE